jgi:dTDP-4-amino-4,6-dideoxygalactose transaminase
MIPYGRHSINNDDIAAVVAALKSDWFTTGPFIEEFESAIEKVVGAPCISINSGTVALHCTYTAIDLEPGDEMITAPITFIANQVTAGLFGATIVFAKVQPDTANIDPQAVEAAITTRTKASVAVDDASKEMCIGFGTVRAKIQSFEFIQNLEAIGCREVLLQLRLARRNSN